MQRGIDLRRGEKMKKENFIYYVIFALAVITIAVVITGFYVEKDMSKIETKTLTILHTWEEGGQYYFADELGSVYLIGYHYNIKEIRYDDMPKIRFDKLEEGYRYNVEYVLRQGNVRLSVGEKEMVR